MCAMWRRKKDADYIRATCPKCGKRVKAPRRYEGLHCTCPSCYSEVMLPVGSPKEAKKAEEERPKSQPEQTPAEKPTPPLTAAPTLSPARESAPTATPQREVTEEPPPVQEEATESIETRRSKSKIMVAEDNPHARDSLADFLKSSGYRVEIVSDGMEAVEKARTGEFNLFILDITLPKLSGFQVCQNIKDPLNSSNATCMHTPVIFTGEKAKGRDVQYAKSLGGVGFFEKPIVFSDILKRIDRTLSRGELHIR